MNYWTILAGMRFFVCIEMMNRLATLNIGNLVSELNIRLLEQLLIKGIFPVANGTKYCSTVWEAMPSKGFCCLHDGGLVKA